MSCNHALSISTYFSHTTPQIRLTCFKECINSLLQTEFSSHIFLVDDCSPKTDHLTWLNTIDTKNRITVVRRPYNGGISKCKNTGIRLILEHGYDIGFLADDDLLYQHPTWHCFYLEAIEHTNYPHFVCCYNPIIRRPIVINNYPLTQVRNNYGCFLTFDKKCIDTIGYFKVFPYKYGFEHEHFSNRILSSGIQPYAVDVNDSVTHVKLNSLSTNASSISIDNNGVDENRKISKINDYHIKQPCIE